MLVSELVALLLKQPQDQEIRVISFIGTPGDGVYLEKNAFETHEIEDIYMGEHAVTIEICRGYV
jgi:hypothetical protein